METNKKALRQKMLKRRSGLDKKEVEELSLKITKKLIESIYFEKAKVLMTYINFNNEVRTREIIEECWLRGKKVIVPICKKDETDLIPSELKSFEELQKSSFGVLEPSVTFWRSFPIEEIDLVLVPGLAFDLKGQRLGYGKGYYDHFLKKLLPHSFTVGLAFEEQILPQVPAEDHDVPLKALLTPERWIIF